MNEEEFVKKFLRRNYLVSPDFLESFDGDDGFEDKIKSKEKPLVLNRDILSILKRNEDFAEISWLEFEKSRAFLEKGKDSKIYESFLDILNYNTDDRKKKRLDAISLKVKEPEKKIVVEREEKATSVVVVNPYIEDEIKKKTVDNFVQYFKLRYKSLRDILLLRQELQGSISINKVFGNRDNVCIIGMIKDKKVTKNGNFLITLEDLTGEIKVLINKNNQKIGSMVDDLVLDEVIGVVGVSRSNLFFCDNLYFPDIPIGREVKRSSEDVCVAFISDIHVGSSNFLKKEFLKFIRWLNGEEENKLAQKIKYLFIVGDVIEGVGVYPEQEKNLEIFDVKKQYSELAGYLDMIRKDVRIILCPGDHDAVRLTHPQPFLSKKYAKDLWDIKNLTLVSNPSMVNIHASQNFLGFNVLMYHGHGYHFFMDAEVLRQKDAPHNPRYVMQFLLKKRHLSPSHTATIYIPDEKKDCLLIDMIPDIFVSGHLHKADVSTYNNVIIINCGCWQSQTDFELKTGNFPDPGKVPVLNLKSRIVEVLDFNG